MIQDLAILVTTISIDRYFCRFKDREMFTIRKMQRVIVPSISTIVDLHRIHAVEVQPETLQIGDVVYYDYTKTYHIVGEKNGDDDKFTCRLARDNSWWDCWGFSFRAGKIEKVGFVDETGRIIV